MALTRLSFAGGCVQSLERRRRRLLLGWAHIPDQHYDYANHRLCVKAFARTGEHIFTPLLLAQHHAVIIMATLFTLVVFDANPMSVDLSAKAHGRADLSFLVCKVSPVGPGFTRRSYADWPPVDSFVLLHCTMTIDPF